MARRASPPEVPSPAGRWHASVARVWFLTAALYITGLALMVLAGGAVGALEAPHHLPWWVLAVLFWAAEAKVVHFHFRRDAQSFSLNEIPLVLGLFFAQPADLVVGLVVGSGIALGIHRRQSRLKLAFNLSHFFLGAVIAAIVFNRVVATDPLGPEGWAGAIIGTVVATLVGHAAIVCALQLSGGQPEVDKLPRVLLLGLVATTANAALGLIAATLLWVEPRAAWLMIVPAVVSWAAYQAYLSERSKSETIEFIYESTRLLHRSPEVDSVVLGLLGRARQMFRAERAELTLFPVNDRDPAARTSIGPGDEVEVMARVEVREDERVWAQALAPGEPALYPSREGTVVLVPSLAERAIRDAMVWVVRADDRVVATLVVANRIGDLATFDPADLSLFQTLAENVDVVLASGQLEQSLAQLRRLEAELAHQAHHDPLTHLANRPRLLDEIDAAGPDSWVVILDLDDFKTVNDGLGHGAGDQLLQNVAQRLAGLLGPGELAARLGGDEFALVVHGGEPAAAALAQAALSAVRAPLMVAGEEVRLRASAGAAPTRDRSADEVLRDADVAMYTAKAQGKDRWVPFEPGMHTAVIERHSLLADLQRAVDRDELVLHYQPIVDLGTTAIVAVEALVRWQHPRRGLVGPLQFVPLAEESGLIVPIGRAVLEKACRQAAIWRARFPGHADLAMSVNLSPRQVQQPGIVDEVIRLLDECGLAPAGLMLEITESALMQDTESTIAKLVELRRRGVRLAIDDFGTGWSSLSYLARLPLDTLKVAKPFVDGLDRSDQEAAFTHAIVRLGQTAQLRLIAEGIERAAQLDSLRSVACDMGQGYFFGRPLEAAAIEELLAAGVALPARPPLRAIS